MIFGKRVSEYLAFQKVCLAVLAAVGLTRLGLSLAGVSNAAAMWLSMNVVTWGSAFYYGIAAARTGFGSYRQLLPLMFFQMVVQQAIAVLGILLAIAGYPNIYAAPEYSFGAQSQWLHVLAHLTIGLILPSLILWGAGSLAMLVTKKLGRRPAVA